MGIMFISTFYTHYEFGCICFFRFMFQSFEGKYELYTRLQFLMMLAQILPHMWLVAVHMIETRNLSQGCQESKFQNFRKLTKFVILNDLGLKKILMKIFKLHENQIHKQLTLWKINIKIDFFISLKKRFNVLFKEKI